MKVKHLLSLILMASIISACGDDSAPIEDDITPISTQKSAKTEQNNNAVTSEPAEQLAQSSNFATLDINILPVSSKDLGTFPYFPAPDGYYYATSKQRENVEKYFFDQSGKLLRVKSSRYFIAQLKPKPNASEAPEIVRKSYEQAIASAGGVQVSSGPAPETLAKEYSLNAPPSYWKDLLNPLGAQYAQYVIRKANEVVWIELAMNPNDPQIDVTIMSAPIEIKPEAAASTPITDTLHPQEANVS